MEFSLGTSASLPTGSAVGYRVFHRLNSRLQLSPYDSDAKSLLNTSPTPAASNLPSTSTLDLQPDSCPISPEQLAAEVKGIYAGLVMAEAKCINMDATKSSLGSGQWQALIALHRTLLYEHHDFLMTTQHPSASEALRGLAAKYSMPARMWKHGIHAFLEVLRHRRPESQEFMLFIYLAYQMMALLFETMPSFTDTWIECLGDLARYRMAIEEENEPHGIWGGVAAGWYTMASDRYSAIGRQYHHLDIPERLTSNAPLAMARNVSPDTHLGPIPVENIPNFETFVNLKQILKTCVKIKRLHRQNLNRRTDIAIMHEDLRDLLADTAQRQADQHDEQAEYVARSSAEFENRLKQFEEQADRIGEMSAQFHQTESLISRLEADIRRISSIIAHSEPQSDCLDDRVTENFPIRDISGSQSDLSMKMSMERLLDDHDDDGKHVDEPDAPKTGSERSDWLDFALPSLIRPTLETIIEYADPIVSSAGSVPRYLLGNPSRNRRFFGFIASLAASSSFFGGALAERHGDIGHDFENPQLGPDTDGSAGVIDILLSLLPFAILTAGSLSAMWTLLSGHGSFPSRLCNSNFTSMLTIVLSLASWVLVETISDVSGHTEQLIQSTLFLWLAFWLNYVALRSKRVSDNVIFLWATLVTTVVISLSCATYTSALHGSDLGARSPVSGIVVEALRFSPVCATGSSMLFARFLSCRPRDADADPERGIAMTRRRARGFTPR